MKNRAGGFIVGILLLLVLVPASVADVPVAELRRAYFATLSAEQKLQAMERIDRRRQLSPRELGAKYRWGSVPADRTPPEHLAVWWNNLSERQKRQYRITWFEKYGSRIAPKLVAEVLEQSEELNQLRRHLQTKIRVDESRFEELPFPGDEPDKVSARPPSIEDVIEDTGPQPGDSADTVVRSDTMNRSDTQVQSTKKGMKPDTVAKSPDGTDTAPMDDAGSDTVTRVRKEQSSDTTFRELEIEPFKPAVEYLLINPPLREIESRK